MFDLVIHNALPLCKVPVALSTGHGRSMRFYCAFLTRWPSRMVFAGQHVCCPTCPHPRNLPTIKPRQIDIS